jgi:hypothetical protein
MSVSVRLLKLGGVRPVQEQIASAQALICYQVFQETIGRMIEEG